MLRSWASRRLWVCANCFRRFSSTASAAASTTPSPSLPPDRAISSRHDDAVLRQLFDAPPSGTASTRFGLGKSQGLFKNRYLTSPEGFLVFARRNLEKATVIVRRVLAASTTSEYQALVRDLDRLSDLLCRVLDLSDFVRMTHPDARFQHAAAEAWSMVYQYMNQLNTMTGLNDQLGVALSRPDVTAVWSEEERTVAKLLKLDFMKSAVNLPKASRDRFVELSSRISDIGSSFVHYMEPEVKAVTLPSDRFLGLYPDLAATLKKRSLISVATTGSEAAAALQSVHDEETRRELFLAQRTASRRTVSLLESMLELRAELSRLAGFESYGHMALKDRMMARSPAAVNEFLMALRRHNAPTVRHELMELGRKKRERLADKTAELRAWDRDFYMEKIRSEMWFRSLPAPNDQLASYFSIGTVMQGLSRLLDRLYGVRFVPREALPGETWHPDVKRLDVVSDDGRPVAVLYCDLFYRPQKSPNPAHFTVRCSREIGPEELSEAAADMNDDTADVSFDSAEQAANDGMETSSSSFSSTSSTTSQTNNNNNGTVMQLPTIALVCDFAKNDNSGEPALLSHHSVETLFHEMGHAVHSILARTRFQNVSGTRCATDFAELPSTLMEHFASDPTVLSLFARHWKTDSPLRYGVVSDRIRIARRFQGLDTEHQILLALVDQAYHAEEVGPGFDSTAVFHQIHSSLSHGPLEPPSTRWQGFFGHLHGYGAGYYSYLFDRVLAERVWRVLFRAGADASAVSRDAGERLHLRLLRWGGARDPWRCLADVLGDDRLAAGDAESMALVGSWGIRNDGSSVAE
ncbi:hypothetical protein CP532_4890 [Ophiocordyceps camponoti-leonardi (nom. inval.)]|nr:hypothetical protein CP532_4890 [Ophiocordyceps camponoti-leonardi (nom. inval.)]